MKSFKKIICFMLGFFLIFTLVGCNDKVEDWRITIKPTLETGGEATRSAKKSEETVKIPALNDSSVWTLVDSKNATCTLDGKKTFNSIYGKVTIIIESAGHEIEYEFTEEPELEKAGKALKKCKNCDLNEQVDVAMLSDVNVWKVTEQSEATHEKDGKVVYESIYGTVTINIKKGEHAFGEWVITKEPTEDKKGEAKQTCPCGKDNIVEIPELLSDIWTVDTKDPTCTVDGYKKYQSIYGTVTVVLEAEGHHYGDWVITKEPTLTDAGKAERHCACGDINKVDISNLADATVWNIKEKLDATHKLEGYKIYSSVYGEVRVEIEKVKHVFGAYEITVKPTLETAGEAKRVCECGEIEITPIANLADTTVWNIKSTEEATHTAKGSITYASIYGEITIDTDMIPHVYEYEITLAPTLESAGKANRTCSCGFIDEIDLPNLADEIWTEGAYVIPTYNDKGYTPYTSLYGEVRVFTEKLVAPYDNKSYSPVYFNGAVDGSAVLYKNDTLLCETSWIGAVCQFDENGCGSAEAYPFFGDNKIKMVNDATGEIELITTRGDSVNVSKGYVDFVSGIIVLQYSKSYNQVLVLSPFENGNNLKASSFKASSWDNAMAISYTYNEVTHKIFISDKQVYFNMEFVNYEKELLAADECYNASYVDIVLPNEEVLVTYVVNVDKLVVCDKYYGKFVMDEDTKFFGYGNGKALYNDAYDIEYEIIDEENNIIDAYVKGVNRYYLITINLLDRTFTWDYVEYDITFVKGLELETETIKYNAKIGVELPVLEDEQNMFKGWYYDNKFKNKVEDLFIPLKDTELYAKWSPKVSFTLSGVLEGDKDVIYLGDGDTLSEFLPKYTVDMVGLRKFVGWFLDKDFEDAASTDVEISVDDAGCILYAKWEDFPEYYGTYYGQEIYGLESCNEPFSIVINYDGTIAINKKSVITGFVTNYENGVITWKENDEDTNLRVIYFNKEAGVIVLPENYVGTTLGTQITVSSSAMTIGNTFDKVFSLRAYQDYNCKLVKLNTLLGSKVVLVYDNKVNVDVHMTDGFGNELAIGDIKDSDTVIIYDIKNNVLFNAGNKPVINYGNVLNPNYALDEYQGEYTNGVDTIKLNGNGLIIYGEKNGTYELVENANYMFDVYLEDNSEYYELTLTDGTFVLNKKMVTITYVVGDGHTAIEQGIFNKNIACILADGADEGFVFNGWFYDALFEEPVEEEFIPTKDMPLYAKYSLPAVLTITFNVEGVDDSVTVYSVGDTCIVENPSAEGKTFVGWYTDSEFALGTEWESGSIINVDTHIYALWELPPAYVGEFAPNYFNSTSGSGTEGGYFSGGYVTMGTDSLGYSKGYPFSAKKDSEGKYINNLRIENYDKVNNTFDLVCFDCSASTQIGTYAGFIDPVSGYFAINYVKNTEEINSVCIYVPYKGEFKSSNYNYNSSYWNNGKTRCISFTFNEQTLNIFVNNNVIYFGVTFETITGTSVLAQNCYNSETLLVKDREDNLLVKCGYLDGVMHEFDGYEGTYSDGDNDLVLNGINRIDYMGNTGTYEFIDEDQIGVYINNEYLEILVDKTEMLFIADKPMVDVVFETFDKANVATVNTNKNIGINLPSPVNDDYLFRGWFKTYEDETFSNGVSNEGFIPVDGITLYAKWIEKVTLTVIYGNTMENGSFTFGKGDQIVINTPAYLNGKAFSNWASDVELENAYELGVINENMTIYVKWVDAVPYFGSYAGTEIWGQSLSSCSGGSKKTLSIDAVGVMSGSNSYTITDYDPVTGNFMAGSRFGYYDSVNEIIVYNYSASNDSIGSDFYIFFKNATDYSMSNSNCCNWNSGYNRVFKCTITVNGTPTDYLIYADGTRIYFNVSIDSTDDNVVISNMGNASDFFVYSSDHVLLAHKVKVSGSVVDADSYYGTYTNDENTLFVNGGNVVVLNGSKGTYVKKQDENRIDLTMDDGFYEVTLDTSLMTYEINKPMVTIQIDTNNLLVVEPLVKNKNVSFNLEDLSLEGYTFRGFYKESSYSTSISKYNYKPTESTTIYAKFDINVTLTIIYGNTLDPEVKNYASGDTVSLTMPSKTNNLVFEGWYTDASFNNPYVAGKILENTTIYCNWQEPSQFAGKYYYKNIYKDGNGSLTLSGYISSEVTIDENGNLTCSGCGGLLSNYNAETGTINSINNTKVYKGFYVAEYDMFVFNYYDVDNTNGKGVHIGRDFNILVNNSSWKLTGKGSSIEDNIKIFELSLNDVTHTMFIYNDMVYMDVTISSVNNPDVTLLTAYNTSDLVVKDKLGTVIYSR